ncbi:WcaF family extracellular polysaccharide biosynthesis acetyltransferase [Thiomicrorhabdus sp. Milos-T2]|uniref:WcaF family extracellular polysaccharide biosynthesis acetyltransferase n=1 Tax=Thiomicrorhabdus sp. Milos-T2 TaxID=90814 RepID=UPI000493C88E|nr:WcaF family extracellular polysaccharide biosynthesis acetyltransferase [Thiomicrorhabdus sp. Milos-T2]
MIKQGINPYQQASFSLKNRLARVFWGVIYLLFFRFSPRPLHGYRAFILKLFGAKLGKDCHVYPTAKIWAPWNLEMDDNAGLASEVICYNMAKIKIGKKAVVSQGSHLCTGTHDYTDPNFQLYALPIKIGEQAWLCTECFISPGVKIGDGAVIGARSVVTKDIPEWMVCAGMPAKPIKQRVIKDNE